MSGWDICKSRVQTKAIGDVGSGFRKRMLSEPSSPQISPSHFTLDGASPHHWPGNKAGRISNLVERKCGTSYSSTPHREIFKACFSRVPFSTWMFPVDFYAAKLPFSSVRKRDHLGLSFFQPDVYGTTYPLIRFPRSHACIWPL